jgi:hypothetical protein
MTSEVDVLLVDSSVLGAAGVGLTDGSDPRRRLLDARRAALERWSRALPASRVVRLLPAVGGALVETERVGPVRLLFAQSTRPPACRLVPHERRRLGERGPLAVAPRAEHDVGPHRVRRSSGPGPVVGVLDTGVSDHVELAGAHIPSARFDVNGRQVPGPASDIASHGTAIAAIVGGKTIGVAPGVRLASARVFDTSETSLAAVLAGLEWLVSEAAIEGTDRPGCDLVNCSLGALTADPRLERALVRLRTHFGVQTIAAVGNRGADHDVDAPAAQRDVLAVGSHDGSGAMYVNSDWSVRPFRKPDVCALGVEVMSADAAGPRDYALYTGTSFAAARVTGAMARLLWADAALLSAPSLWRDALKRHCRRMVPPQDVRSTMGRVDFDTLP